VRWIVFDYGEVICRKSEAMPVLAGLLGTTTDEFAAAYWGEREPYDLGGSDLDFWRAVGARVGTPVDEALSAELSEIDIAGWLHPDEGTLALIAELAGAGVPLALLSNAPSSFGRAAEREPWTRHFRHLVFSGDLGVTKPDPRIWLELTRRLGVTPADCVFLDDRQVNVDGALAAGVVALLWRDSAGAREELVRLGVLDDRPE
jgi:putative hydrolase of the HAD superfamily